MAQKRTPKHVPDKTEKSQNDKQHIHILNTILSATTEFISMFDKQGRYLYASENIATLLGMKQNDFLGKTWQEIGLPAAFMEPFDLHRQKVMATGQTVREEMLFPVDTQLRWFEYVASPVVDVYGEVESVVVSWNDTTEHKQTEEAMQESDRQKINILESITDAFFALDTSYQLTYANKQAEILLMMRREELVGRSLWELFPEIVGSTFDQQYHKAVSEGVAVAFEEFYPAHNIWYEIHAYPSSSGLAVYFRDVTSRRKALDVLRQSEESFRLLADAMPQIVWTSRPDGWIDYYNQKWFEYTGMTLEQTQGWNWVRAPVLHPADLQKCRDAWNFSVETGEGFEIENRFKRAADGVYHWHLVRALPVRDSNGAITRWFGTCTDIDDQKRSEDALRLSEVRLRDQAKDLELRGHELERTNAELSRQHDDLTVLNSALEEANRVRSQFFSTMSHELRTPLASIIGFSQMLLDNVEKANVSLRQQTNQERILKNAKHLLVLINDVLDLSKMDAGRMDATYSQVDVSELLTSVVEQTQSIALAQNLGLRAEVEEELDFLESDPLKLRQVLLNLVSNALKFTEKGEVIVSARRALSPDTAIESIAFAVQDTGVGIPADMQERIFEAFYQVDGSYTRKVGGTGLGLSIVSQMTALLGGTIGIISAPGQGSTFTVTLPVKVGGRQLKQDDPSLQLARQQQFPTLPPSSEDFTPAALNELFAVSAFPNTTDGQSNLILAVDDDLNVLMMIKVALEGTPYTVVGVQDPLKAITMVHELHPCAITLDVMMPNLNGWQILYQLKDNPSTAAIPIVMLTVLSERTTGYVLGADDYLIKPFKSAALLSTLDRLVLAKQRSSQAGERETQQV